MAKKIKLKPISSRLDMQFNDDVEAGQVLQTYRDKFRLRVHDPLAVEEEKTEEDKNYESFGKTRERKGD